MKARNLFVVPTLLASLALLPDNRVTAQTFATLHSLTGYPNSSGSVPWAGLIINSSGNTLYGTGSQDGNALYGTVFAVNTDGTGFTTLHNFAGGLGYPFDGGEPGAGLILSGNALYGTASGGGYNTGAYGSGGNGTIFRVNTNGAGYATVYNFTSYSGPNSTNSDGANPHAGLMLSGNTLYGTAIHGGSYGYGTVFGVNADGTGFTNLHNFVGYPGDGANPYGGLILTGNTLYGTAMYGGSSDQGAVFAINTDGTGFSILYGFSALNNSTNSDGANPQAALILSGNTLYGTTMYGGSSGNGTVFAVKTDGTGFSTLYHFSALYNSTNGDGAHPAGGLVLSGSTLYGTTEFGGSSANGTMFAVNTNGTGFTNLYSFSAASGYPGCCYTNNDGAYPLAGLIISRNTLYGTASYGGSSGKGTVFSLSFPLPQLTIAPSGVPPRGIILSWPANVAGFDYTGYTLQSTTNLLLPTAWVTNSPAPVVVAGQYTVTNPITGAQQFYRLIK